MQLYTYKYLAETKFSNYAKSHLGWIAQYNSNCTYNGTNLGDFIKALNKENSNSNSNNSNLTNS